MNLFKTLWTRFQNLFRSKSKVSLERLKDHLRRMEKVKIAPCGLSQYRNFVGNLPSPTDQQIENFVEFVAEAHSWYKHLPGFLPGREFFFFIDPMSGFDLLYPDVGGVKFQERTNDTSSFHYTWMTTEKYRSQFGYLSYHVDAGNSFLVPTAEGVATYETNAVFGYNNQLYGIPKEIANAGATEITAVIHKLSTSREQWKWFLEQQGPGTWHKESGGMKTLEAISDLCNGPERKSYDYDIELNQLLAPERQRQKRHMKLAISRVVKSIYQD